jgi:hypothetical protein
MTFRELLSQKNLTVDSLSVKIRGKIKKYEQIEAMMNEQKQKALQEKGVRKKKEMENEIAEAEGVLSEMNAELCKAIERFDKNKDYYAQQGQKLKDAKKGKGGNNNPPADPPTPNDPPADPPTPTDPPADPPQADPTDPPADPPAPKKGSIGWLVGGLLALGLAAVGINYYNNKS